jgi:hypothetical protein
MGNLGGPQEQRDAVTGRRAWENDGRIDLRSVTNAARQLPYHMAYVRGFRECASILNPTRSIDWALESVREMDAGVPHCFSPPHLSARVGAGRLMLVCTLCGCGGGKVRERDRVAQTD